MAKVSKIQSTIQAKNYPIRGHLAKGTKSWFNNAAGPMFSNSIVVSGEESKSRSWLRVHFPYGNSIFNSVNSSFK